MFNKVIIGILIFLLILTGIVCAHVFNLAKGIDALSEQLIVSQEEIDALTEQLIVSQEAIDALSDELLASRKERAAQISAVSDELATFRRETLARIVTLDGELRGVAAIHIEDQVTPKRCGHFEGKQVIAQDEMVSKIKAAVDAREDPDFVLIARTDARALLGSW